MLGHIMSEQRLEVFANWVKEFVHGVIPAEEPFWLRLSSGGAQHERGGCCEYSTKQQRSRVYT